jgi:hypothetical protein
MRRVEGFVRCGVSVFQLVAGLENPPDDRKAGE